MFQKCQVCKILPSEAFPMQSICYTIQITKTSLYKLSENHWVFALFEFFGSVRKKLQSTVFNDHPVVKKTIYVSIHVVGGQSIDKYNTYDPSHESEVFLSKKLQALWEGSLTMVTIQWILMRGLTPMCARSGLLISSKKWLLAEGGLTVWVDIGLSVQV